jgi:23S rRNA pseudouridine1911/1915/1917 synthase
MTEPLVVLFEDAHCLAVVKPAGLLTQGTAAGEPTLEAAVRRYLSPGAPDAPYLGTVHRLDRPASGVVVWARTPKAARRLADQFARRAARKEYWAIVEGDVPPSGPDRDEVWDDWLAPADAAGVVRAVAPGTPRARRALTRVRHGSAARLPAATSWLRLWPETGRTHQLRAQAAARGRPILGDLAYGATRPFPRGIALHARALTLRHPILQTPLTWVAPLPESWDAAGITLPEPPPWEEDGPFRRR